MPSVNIHDAKTHFSRLIERIIGGEAVVIARAGKPVARLVPMDAPARPARLGFLAGQMQVPADFDSMGAGDIEALFGGQP